MAQSTDESSSESEQRLEWERIQFAGVDHPDRVRFEKIEKLKQIKEHVSPSRCNIIGINNLLKMYVLPLENENEQENEIDNSNDSDDDDDSGNGNSHGIGHNNDKKQENEIKTENVQQFDEKKDEKQNEKKDKRNEKETKLVLVREESVKIYQFCKNGNKMKFLIPAKDTIIDDGEIEDKDVDGNHVIQYAFITEILCQNGDSKWCRGYCLYDDLINVNETPLLNEDFFLIFRNKCYFEKDKKQHAFDWLSYDLARQAANDINNGTFKGGDYYNNRM